ncbi:MAG: sulfatase-like hydrolase/transferase [Rickettsiales bacterium]|jgi:phosphoglycerol transferase|nr:sulfatase-like hydrolase/transferase [Rickettsiales bacterium]
MKVKLSRRGVCLFAFYFLLAFPFCFYYWVSTSFFKIAENGSVLSPLFVHIFANIVDGATPELVRKFISYCVLLPLLISGLGAYASVRSGWIWRGGAVGLYLFALLAAHSYIKMQPADKEIIKSMFAPPSTFYEENYVAPADVNITFGEKRNLVLVILESVDLEFANAELLGRNAIPRLHAMYKENPHAEGYSDLPGMNFTIGGITGIMCGVPLNYVGNSGAFLKGSGILPNAVCVAEILRGGGYVTGMAIASTGEFSGKRHFAEMHGFEHVWDGISLREAHPEISEDKYFWGGVEDETTLKYAFENIAALKKSGKPYFVAVETVNTHSPFYISESCAENWGERKGGLVDAVACNDKVIGDFIDKVRRLDPTAAVLVVSDHNLMSPPDEFANRQNRWLVNFMINSSRPVRAERRVAAFDWFPTLVEMAGGRMKGRRLGLGTSVFSDVPNVLERYPEGIDALLVRKNLLYMRLMGVK